MNVDFKIHSCTWLPPEGYIAITLFNHVIVRGTKEEVDEYLQTTYGKITINHERIHIIQGRKLGWIRFYTLYLHYYLAARRSGLPHDEAYYAIPFECEAFANECNFDYNETHWDNYIYPPIN